MPDEVPVPRVFISYSHDNDGHKAWVLRLANRLIANGVDVLLDQWDLRLGSDLPRFIELGLSDADRVLAVCSSTYVDKANDGLGGVGYEKMILTALMMENVNEDRVIPLLRGNPNAARPTFLRSRVYLDFRDDAAFEQRYVELIRELHGKRVLARPPIGSNPFSEDGSLVPAFSRGKYVSPELAGRVTFDYSNNDGIYTVGLGDMAFHTRWARAWTSSIYVYRNGENMASIALAVGVESIADLRDASLFDDSSSRRQPELRDIVIWRNRQGYYLATQVEFISVRHGTEWKDEVTFSYVIQPNRTPVFGI